MKRPTPDQLLAAGSESTRRLNARAAGNGLARSGEHSAVSKALPPPQGPRTGKDCPAGSLWAAEVMAQGPVSNLPPAKCSRGRRKPPAPSTKAEAEWLAYLRRVFVDAIIRAHGMTLVFPDGDRYTPDVAMWHHGHLTIYEVKAGYRGPGWEQGTERYKRAKAEWYWLDFRLAEKRRDGWHLDGKPCTGSCVAGRGSISNDLVALCREVRGDLAR